MHMRVPLQLVTVLSCCSEDFLANFAEISERTTTVRPSLNRKGGRSQLEECLPESVWLGMQGGHQGSRRPAAREGTWDMDELEGQLNYCARTKKNK